MGSSRRELLRDWRRHAAVLAEKARELLGDARIIVFGSVVRGDWTADSDVDVLVVSSKAPEDPWERARIVLELREAVGARVPLEIHLVTPEQYEGWYKRFIDVYEEIA